MPNYTSRKIEEFEKKLDEWLQTKEHKYQCIGYNEGQQCCLEHDSEDGIFGTLGRKNLVRILTDTLEEQKAAVVRRLERQKERIYPEDDVQAQEWKGAQNDHIDMLIKGLDKEPIIIDNFTGGYQPKERLTTLQ